MIGASHRIVTVSARAWARAVEHAAELVPPEDGGRLEATSERASAIVAARTMRADVQRDTIDYLRRAAPRGTWSSDGELSGELFEAEREAERALAAFRSTTTEMEEVVDAE